MDGSRLYYWNNQWGFVVQITDPGTYYLYYQVEDSAGEYSRVVGYSIKVIEASRKKHIRRLKVSFLFKKILLHDFSIDFSQMDSAAVCLVRKAM